MAQDSIALGPVPYEEECEQVGPKYDPARARLECKTFVAQLTRSNPPPEGGRFRIKSNPHDFGAYLDVEAVFNEDFEAATEWAYGLESNGPAEWDAESKTALGL